MNISYPDTLVSYSLMIMKLKKYMKVVYEQSELSTTGLPDDTVMGYEEGSKEYRTDTI